MRSDDDDGGIEDVSGKGLIEEAHYDLFLRWVAFGGLRRGLSPLEVAEMTPEMTADFMWLMGEYNKEQRRAQKLAKEKQA